MEFENQDCPPVPPHVIQPAEVVPGTTAGESMLEVSMVSRTSADMPPPTYEQAISRIGDSKIATMEAGSAEGEGSIDASQMSTVAAGYVQGEGSIDGEGEAKRQRLAYLPQHFNVGIVYLHFEADLGTKQATGSEPLEAPFGCSFSQLVLICNTMLSSMGNTESAVSTANTFLHAPFQDFITQQLKNFIPDLGALHDLRNHSMKYILEKCIQDSANPQKLIAELLARLFGVMCLLWDLLLKEKGWKAQINAQAAGIEIMQNKLKDIHEKCEKQQRAMRKNLQVSETISTSLKMLKATDKTPETAENNAVKIGKMEETLAKVSENLALMKEGRQEDMLKICKSGSDMAVVETTLAMTAKDLVKEQDKNSKLTKEHQASTDRAVSLHTQNNVLTRLVDSKDQTITALRQQVALLQGQLLAQQATAGQLVAQPPAALF